MEKLTDPLPKTFEKSEPGRGGPTSLQSKQTFLRDLPALLGDPKHDRWCVAYCGNELIGIAPSELDLLRECQKRGLKSDQYFIGLIAPYDPDVEIEQSLYEFDPIEK